MNDTVGPSLPGERIEVLDVIRGFALLGILLMNIEYFQRPMQAIMLGLDTTQAGADYAVAWFSFTFIQGKFYTMFSLLFGMGFVIFLDRALARNAPAKTLFARRLAVLLGFGAAHAFLVWSGDILLFYAVIGFLLLFFVHTPASRLWKWGIGMLIIPVVLMWLGALGIEAAMQGPDAGEMQAGFEADRAALARDIAAGEAIYREGTWAEAVRWRVHEISSLYAGGGFLFFLPAVLGMFLLGAAFVRSGIFRDPAAHRAKFVKIALVGYAAGLPAALVWGLYGAGADMLRPTYATAALFSLQMLSNLALCLAYVSTLVLLLTAGRRWLLRLAPAGRMALTNYLTHSVVFTLLFYGYGLGLYGEFGRAAATLMALALYGIQLWFSGWWLRRFRFGPVEWVWRCLTYGQRQPNRLG